MKVKTLLDGFDGFNSYEAGDVLEGDSEHIRMLLHNLAAEPLDAAAKQVADMRDKMTSREFKENKLHSEGIGMAVKEAATVEKGVKTKQAVRKVKRKK